MFSVILLENAFVTEYIYKAVGYLLYFVTRERIYKSGFDLYSGTTPFTCDFFASFSSSRAFSTAGSCSASHFSASNAAIHPEPGSRSQLVRAMKVLGKN